MVCHLPSHPSFQAFSPLAVDKSLQILLMDSHEVSYFERPYFSLAYPFPHGPWFDQEEPCGLFDGVNPVDHRLHRFRKGLNTCFWHYPLSARPGTGEEADPGFGIVYFCLHVFHHTYMELNSPYMFVYVT